MSRQETRIWGLMVEFDDVAEAVHAAEKVRDAGYECWDTHTPFPVHGLSDAMGMRDTRLPWLVLVCGATGMVLGLAMQLWMNGIDYPLNIAGKPLFGIPANIPIVFESTVLFAAISAFVGMLIANGLPRWYQPVLRSERFRRVTNDRFFIVIEARDPSFDVEKTRAFLESLGGLGVEVVED